MRQLPSSPMFSLGAPWLIASSLVALAAFEPMSASAQIIVGAGQRPGNVVPSPQPAPVVIHRQTNPGSMQPAYPGAGQVYQQSSNNSHYYQYSNGYSSQQGSPGSAYRYGPGGSVSSSQSYRTQSYQAVPPNVGYQNQRLLPGGVSSDASVGLQTRLYSNRLPRTLLPGGPTAASGAPSIHPRPPVSNNGGDRSIYVTTSRGQRSVPYRQYNNNYIYSDTTIVDGPSLLGGYYYGNYSDTFYANGPCYPSVYSSYPGMPQYIVNPGVIVLSDPYYPAYQTPYQPFYAPVYQVTYNQNNYYVGSEDHVQQIQDGGQTATRALKNAYPADSFQAAFGDIQNGWKTGDVSLIRKHIRDSETTLSVYFKGKYSYSIASSDFVKITRDAFDRLSTVSFDFTRLRKAKNGDVTAYGKHIYQAAGGSDASGEGANTDNTVSFSADGSHSADTTQPYDKSDDPTAGAEKTIYISYTLRKHDDQWFIIGVDSSPTDLVK